MIPPALLVYVSWILPVLGIACLAISTLIVLFGLKDYKRLPEVLSKGSWILRDLGTYVRPGLERYVVFFVRLGTICLALTALLWLSPLIFH